MSSSEKEKRGKYLINSDEMDLIKFFVVLWNGRKLVIKTTIISLSIGLFIAVFSQKEYTASTTIVPQTNSSKSIGGNLGGLAAIAGINLGGVGSSSSIEPSLYPQIVYSTPFQKELLNTLLSIKGQNLKISYEKYYSDVYKPSTLGYIKKYTLGLPGIIIKAFKKESPSIVSNSKASDILEITIKELELIEELKSKIVVEVNIVDGYVILSSKMPEPKAASELVKQIQILLQKYIIDFKIKKSTKQLKFINDRYLEKQKSFKKIQKDLAQFVDQNQNVNSAQAKMKINMLQSEYDLAFTVYTELAKQLETQYIQVKDDTPVFTIIKPVVVPLLKSSPKRLLILIIWGVIGFSIAVGILFFKSLPRFPSK